jgi:hypothetical protein
MNVPAPQNGTELPPYGRLIAAGLVAAGVLGLVLNHFVSDRQSVASLLMLCFAPLGLFLGLGGLVEPRIMWSVGKYGKHLPVKFKIVGCVLAAAGVAVTLLLVFLVYPLGN